MATITTRDGTQLCFKDWGEGQLDGPTLFLHGDDDQIVPVGASALRAAEIVRGSTLKVYAGGNHGLCSTQKDQVNADLLAFLKEPS